MFLNDLFLKKIKKSQDEEFYLFDEIIIHFDFHSAFIRQSMAFHCKHLS
jgi:hypothetical protein